MVAWDRVTKADVERALREYDRLGPEDFFATHGFSYTTTYEPFKRLSAAYLKQLRKQTAQRPGIQNNAALRQVVDNADARRLCELHLEHAQAPPGKP